MWGEQQKRCLREARRYGKSTAYTAREFAQATGIPHEIVHKRFPDLAALGLMHRRGCAACKVSGRMAVLWSAHPGPESSGGVLEYVVRGSTAEA